MIEKSQPSFHISKRLFDMILSFAGILALSPLCILIAILVVYDSGFPFLFIQKRVGQFGKLFEIIKFRTMYSNCSYDINKSSITTKNDKRITRVGKILRKWKLDELPTLINVLLGNMSMVGPRPDVPGYIDGLKNGDRRILLLKPGITGLATLKYADEEKILASVANPKKYNDEIIFPDKVRINLYYMNNWSLQLDIIIILKTVFRRNY